MGLVIVFAIAVAVGVIVFRLTGGGVPASQPDDVMPWAGGEVAERRAPEARAPSAASSTRIQVSPETEIPVVTARRSWHSRLNGALGLVVLIGIGAVAIAFGLYGIGMLIARILSAGSGTDVTV
jgi:hypothetical protein